MATQADKKTQVQNLGRFVSSLPPCNVAFLFFFAGDLENPHVICTSRAYDFNNKTYFMVQAKDPSYLYVYKETALKYLVSNFKCAKSSPGSIYKVNIEECASTGEDCDWVSMGNHLDFSIGLSRKTGIYYKIHYTEYISREDNGKFDRQTTECNIDALPKVIKSPLAHFKKTQCFGRPDQTIGWTFRDATKYDMDLIQKLCQISLLQAEGPFQSGGVPYTVLVKKYKSLGIFDKIFSDFIKHHILIPIKNHTWEFEFAYAFYDLAGRLQPVATKWIFIVLYFTNHTANIVGLNAHQALKAAYAETNPNTCSQKEIKCLKKVLTRYNEIIESILG